MISKKERLAGKKPLIIDLIGSPGVVSVLGAGIAHLSWPARSPRDGKVLLVRRRP